MEEGFLVNRVAGYEIRYNASSRQFEVLLEGEACGQAELQDGAEAIARRLGKNAKAFPIPVIVNRYNVIVPGRITSFDPQGGAGFVTTMRHQVGGGAKPEREKMYFRRRGEPNCFEPYPAQPGGSQRV